MIGSRRGDAKDGRREVGPRGGGRARHLHLQDAVVLIRVEVALAHRLGEIGRHVAGYERADEGERALLELRLDRFERVGGEKRGLLLVLAVEDVKGAGEGA